MLLVVTQRLPGIEPSLLMVKSTLPEFPGITSPKFNSKLLSLSPFSLKSKLAALIDILVVEVSLNQAPDPSIPNISTPIAKIAIKSISFFFILFSFEMLKSD